MTRDPPRTAETPRREANGFLRKAKEFIAGAQQGLQEGRPNGAALEAIHAATAASDALTIWHLGQRSRGEDHQEVLRLIRGVPGVSESKLERQLLDVLSVKNNVEYGGEGISVERAETTVTQARRIVDWVEKSVRQT